MSREAGSVSGTDVEQDEKRPVVGRSRVLTVLVLRFPDAAAAQQAAREIDAVDAAVSPDNVAVAIPNHAAALGHWRPNVPTLAATIAYESFVVTLLIGHTTPDLGAMTGVARKAFDAQMPRLREFSATPRDKLATLPLDRDRLLARMLPEVPGRWPYPVVITRAYEKNAGWHAAIDMSGVVLGPRGARLYRGRKQDPPAELYALTISNGLLQFSDATAARRAFMDTSITDDPVLRPAAGPAGVPDARCFEQLDVPSQYPIRFICEILYGRYTATVHGHDIKDAHQQATAQLGLLVGSE
ncbi:DUF7373 family lipoprotein [Nocardia sp. CA-128927]|uniref:DUF7373 family lipoprotein n=1 Tax=Nocardia sp. CA-128927 TaxID=3239975 RepID=UPI003D954717